MLPPLMEETEGSSWNGEPSCLQGQGPVEREGWLEQLFLDHCLSGKL